METVIRVPPVTDTMGQWAYEELQRLSDANNELLARVTVLEEQLANSE